MERTGPEPPDARGVGACQDVPIAQALRAAVALGSMR
jgi:hypothetical protein